MNSEVTGRARGGRARADKLTPERRKEIAVKAANAKRERGRLPKATHGSQENPLRIGNIEIPCYVLEDGTRVLTQRGVTTALGMSKGSGSVSSGGDRLSVFSTSRGISPHINNELTNSIKSPIRFVQKGGGLAFGYPATLLPDLCEAVLKARDAGTLNYQQEHIAKQCEILVRGFARVGIIALVDEATGYQRDRTRDALAKILEAYVAKELQPWVKTFDSEYYEQMFRLRDIPYPPERSNYRPSYFGHLTNDVVYSRLAPGVLDALKDEAKKEAKRTHLHQHLTAGFGRQELLKHLGMVIGFMKVSNDWNSFIETLDRVATKFNKTLPLELVEKDA